MGIVFPAPSNGETYKAVEVEWTLPLAIVPEPCPAASAAASTVKRDQARCVMVQHLQNAGSVDLRGAKSGTLYAWVPQGAQAPHVYLGGTEQQAQFLPTDSTARFCTPQSDCNVIWVPISVDLKVNYTDDALAALSFDASVLSANYPAVKFALFENITLAYPPSPGSSLPNELSTSTPSGGQPTSPLPKSTDTNNRPSDATPSLFPTSSNPLVPITSAIPARGSTSQIGATSTGGHHANASVIVPAVLCALFGVAAVTFGVLWWLARRRGRAQMAPSAAFRANPETAWVPIDEKRQHLAGDGAGPSSTV